MKSLEEIRKIVTDKLISDMNLLNDEWTLKEVSVRDMSGKDKCNPYEFIFIWYFGCIDDETRIYRCVYRAESKTWNLDEGIFITEYSIRNKDNNRLERCIAKAIYEYVSKEAKENDDVALSNIDANVVYDHLLCTDAYEDEWIEYIYPLMDGSYNGSVIIDCVYWFEDDRLYIQKYFTSKGNGTQIYNLTCGEKTL